MTFRLVGFGNLRGQRIVRARLDGKRVTCQGWPPGGEYGRIRGIAGAPDAARDH
jgi:hypothetical protein